MIRISVHKKILSQAILRLCSVACIFMLVLFGILTSSPKLNSQQYIPYNYEALAAKPTNKTITHESKENATEPNIGSNQNVEPKSPVCFPHFQSENGEKRFIRRIYSRHMRKVRVVVLFCCVVFFIVVLYATWKLLQNNWIQQLWLTKVSQSNWHYRQEVPLSASTSIELDLSMVSSMIQQKVLLVTMKTGKMIHCMLLIWENQSLEPSVSSNMNIDGAAEICWGGTVPLYRPLKMHCPFKAT